MAGHRTRIGTAAAASAALGLAAVSAWIALRDPSHPMDAAGRTGAPGGAPVARTPPTAKSAALGPGSAREAPESGPAADTGTGRDRAAGWAADTPPGLAPSDGGLAPQIDHATDDERQQRERLASGMAKLMSDLEWSPGLKEPPQQLVAPQPDPWKRDPGREGPSPAIEAMVPRRARAGGGDRISIRGRNFRVVQVMFGTTPARLVAARGNEVIVETPPGADGPVTVAVTNDDGTWAIAAEPFVYGD